MIRGKFAVGFNRGMGAEQTPQRDALAGIPHKQFVVRREPQFMADGDMDRADVADLVGDFSQPGVHLMEKRPIRVLGDVLQLLHADKKFVQAKHAEAGRAPRERKRVLLELADKIGEAKPRQIGFNFAGLVARPIARFFG